MEELTKLDEALADVNNGTGGSGDYISVPYLTITFDETADKPTLPSDIRIAKIERMKKEAQLEEERYVAELEHSISTSVSALAKIKDERYIKEFLGKFPLLF